MLSPCCVALIIVLIIVILAVVGARRYVRDLIHKWKTQEGNLPSPAVVDDIGYTSYLPTQLPDPAKFDVDLAAFTIRACESAVNRRLGGDTQLPQGLVEVGRYQHSGILASHRLAALVAQVAHGGELRIRQARHGANVVAAPLPRPDDRDAHLPHL